MSEVNVPHARESYRPPQAAPTAKLAFAQWMERVAGGLPDLVASRELAGLSDEQLSALAREFEQAPRYKRDDIFRFSFTIAGLLAMLGAGFAYGEATAPIRVAGFTPLVAGAGASFGAAFIALCTGTWTRLRLVPNEAAYAKVGLLVGALNERHPWLYNAYFVLRNPAALGRATGALRCGRIGTTARCGAWQGADPWGLIRGALTDRKVRARFLTDLHLYTVRRWAGAIAAVATSSTANFLTSGPLSRGRE